MEMFSCKREPKSGATGTRDSLAKTVSFSWTLARSLAGCCSVVLFARRCPSFKKFVLRAFAVDRSGLTATGETEFLTSELLHVEGALDGRRNSTDPKDCDRCANTRDGKAAVKTNNTNVRLPERNICPPPK